MERRRPERVDVPAQRGAEGFFGAREVALGETLRTAVVQFARVESGQRVGSPILKAKSVQLGERDFTPTFTVEQMLKDLSLIIGAGQALHAPLPQTAMTQQLMQAAVAQGDALDDYAAVIKALERSAGLATGREQVLGKP